MCTLSLVCRSPSSPAVSTPRKFGIISVSMIRGECVDGKHAIGIKCQQEFSGSAEDTSFDVAAETYKEDVITNSQTGWCRYPNQRLRDTTDVARYVDGAKWFCRRLELARGSCILWLGRETQEAWDENTRRGVFANGMAFRLLQTT